MSFVVACQVFDTVRLEVEAVGLVAISFAHKAGLSQARHSQRELIEGPLVVPSLMRSSPQRTAAIPRPIQHW